MTTPRRGVGAQPPQSVKFVSQDAVTGLPIKRKQVPHACDQCKRRKKRCDHSQEDPEASDAAAQLLRFQSSSHDSETESPAASSATAVPSPDARHVHAKLDRAAPFLGDLNPEAVFVEATMTEVSRIAPVEAEGDARLGFWGSSDAVALDKAPQDSLLTGACVRPQDVQSTPHLIFPGPAEARTIIPVTDWMAFAKHAAEAIAQELAAVVRPRETDWAIMRRIYLTKIHPIFPIFEVSGLTDLSQYSQREVDLIKASICLAAASDRGASEHLFLSKPSSNASERKTELVSYSEYSQAVVSFIKEGVRLLSTKESIQLVNKIRIMALTCVYWQPEHAARTEPLDFYAGLASIVHTYGIHLKEMVDTKEPAQEPRHDGVGRGDLGRLFRCLYALDRLTGSLSGRPLLFHNYDLLMIPQSDKNDSPSFKLFMSIIMLLDKTISLYRPHAKEDHIDVPVLERLILDAGAQCEPDGILATLEILYHAVCVLSVRMPRDRFKTSPQMDAVSGVTYSHLPPSILNARRSHSSDRIFDIIKEPERYQLSPMPFIAYALSLSLTTAYRKWRFSQTPMFRARGKDNFKDILPLLTELGKVWTSARINSNLGNVVITHANQAEQQAKSKAPTEGRTVTSPSKRKLLKPQTRRPQAQPRESQTNGPPPSAPVDVSASQTPVNQQLPEYQPSFGAQDAASLNLTSPMGFMNGTTDQMFGDIDDNLFSSWDLVNTVDSCFVSNLDPSYPVQLPDWDTNYDQMV